MATIGPLLTVLCSVFLVLFKTWQDGQPARTQEDKNEATQQGRTDINAAAHGDPAAVLAIDQRVDGLSPPAASGDPVRERSMADLLGGLHECTGASILLRTGGSGEAAGEG
jgi:hypothetical protein